MTRKSGRQSLWAIIIILAIALLHSSFVVPGIHAAESEATAAQKENLSPEENLSKDAEDDSGIENAASDPLVESDETLFESNEVEEEILDLDEDKELDNTMKPVTEDLISEVAEENVAELGKEAESITSQEQSQSVDDVEAEAFLKTDDANTTTTEENEQSVPVQSGPFIDLFGDTLLSLEMIDETKAQLHVHYTNEALAGKSVIGLYFSADWCGPCRKFTPDLVNFYDRMNNKRGYKNKFEIVWISRCRSMETFGQYFTHMGSWYAMQPELAMGPQGEALSKKYKVKSIPTLVLLDEIGSVITLDARNKIPQDKSGVGFPWRNPIIQAYLTLVPRSLRLLIKMQIEGITGKVRRIISPATAVV